MTVGVRTPLVLADRHGRVATDLRVSLTDRCNLRCTYCMPAAGLEWFPTEEVLTDDEVNRVLRVAVESLGVTKIRFTGGEPLLRRSLETIVAATKKLPTRTGGTPELSLTTNGIGLDKRVHALKDAGLDRVNVSLDSLDRDRYAALARRDRLDAVLDGLAAAEAAGLLPVKVNTVVMRGVNEVDVVPLAQFCLERGYQLRYIEQMPLGPRHEWDRAKMVTQAELLALLRQRFRLAPASEERGGAPAELWQVEPDADQPGGLLGVIPSVTAPFCGACDRTRITADGQIRTCLFSRTETDLRTPLRAGASDRELAELWAGAQGRKAAAHGIGEPGFVQPSRTMSAIGDEMRVRYFAGAADAAGVTEETVDADFEVTVADLVEQLGADRDRLAKVLKVSSLLIDGVAVREQSEFIPTGAQVDVLPPFAGG